MSAGSGIRAGKAFVEVATKNNLTRGLKQAQRQLRAFGAGITAMGLKSSAAVAGAFAPLGIVSVKAASDAQESLSRFSQVFGSEMDAAAAFAEDLASRVGRSSLDIKDSLATFQSFFVGLGYGGGRARELSQQMTELGLDLASFNNLTDSDGIDRMIAALSGSSEVLDRFGINTKQAALQQELLAQGVNKSWSAVTEQEKVLARLGIIARSMGSQGAMGDATRTAGSFANQLKRLRGESKDTAAAVGAALLPVLTQVLGVTTTAVHAVRQVIRENPGLVTGTFAVAGVAGAASAALLGMGITASVTAAAVGGLATTLGVGAAVVGAILSPVGLATAAVAGLGVGIVYWSGAGGGGAGVARCPVLCAAQPVAAGGRRDPDFAHQRRPRRRRQGPLGRPAG